jgi:hypothetical protein
MKKLLAYTEMSINTLLNSNNRNEKRMEYFQGLKKYNQASTISEAIFQ